MIRIDKTITERRQCVDMIKRRDLCLGPSSSGRVELLQISAAGMTALHCTDVGQVVIVNVCTYRYFGAVYLYIRRIFCHMLRPIF